MKRKLITVVAAIALSGNVSAENLIKQLWNSMKTSDDLTKSHSNLTKVSAGGPFYFYRLKSDTPVVIEKPVPQESTIPYDHEAIAAALAEQAAKNPDTIPYDEQDNRRIDKNPETTETAQPAITNEREVLYGENSPLEDDAVIAAWERANRAKARLEEHRKYMESVRKARKNVHDAIKQTENDSNQIDE